MPRLSEHERSGGIGMLNDVVNNHNCHPSFIQPLRDRYQATGTVKDRRRSGQLRMATCVKRQLTSIISTIFTSILAGYCQFQTNSRALSVNCF